MTTPPGERLDGVASGVDLPRGGALSGVAGRIRTRTRTRTQDQERTTP